MLQNAVVNPDSHGPLFKEWLYSRISGSGKSAPGEYLSETVGISEVLRSDEVHRHSEKVFWAMRCTLVAIGRIIEAESMLSKIKNGRNLKGNTLV